MNKPAFQFYPGDFIMGTALLTAEEVGGYMRLLCFQWANGFIPDKEKLIMQLTGVYDPESIKTILSKFKKGRDGNFRNERLEIVREDQQAFSEKQRGNGSKGGRPPKPKENPNETQSITQIEPNGKPNHNPEGNPNITPSPSPSPSSFFSTPNSSSEGVNGNPRQNFGRIVKQWWSNATPEQFKKKVQEVIDQFPDAYPKSFIDYFIGYYLAETGEYDDGTKRYLLHQQDKFSIEFTLRNWYTDPDTRKKYPMPVKSKMNYIK